MSRVSGMAEGIQRHGQTRHRPVRLSFRLPPANLSPNSVGRHRSNIYKSRVKGWAWAACMVMLMGLTAVAAPRRILIIHSFGREFAPFDKMTSVFRTELARQFPEPVEFYESSIETARFAEIGNDGPLLAYLQSLFAERHLDLILTVAEPATLFSIRHRMEFFPDVPIVAWVDYRQTAVVQATTNAVIVPIQVKIPILAENILQVLPNTTNVAVVLGASPFEHYWANICRQEFAPFTNHVQFTYLNEMPLEKMCDYVSKLPPRSAVFYGMLAVDAAGVPYEQERALSSIHAAANAPLFGVFESHLGQGIVGGHLLSQEFAAKEAIEAVLRLWGGEKASTINLPPEVTRALYDWRELRRWNISAAHLPAGSEVRYRTPTFWEQYKWQLIGIHAVCLGEGILIFALLRNRRRLRSTQKSLQQSEERLSLATNSAKVGVWSWNVRNETIDATAECKQMFGFGADESVTFTKFLDRVHPDDRLQVNRAIEEAIKNKSVYDTQYRIVLPDGQLRWIAARGRIHQLDEAADDLMGVLLDVTERRRAEEKFRLAVEASPSAIVMVNQQGRIVLVNSETEKAFRYQRNELVGEPVEILLPERYRDQHPGHRRSFFACPETRPMGAGRELFARRKDGSEFPVEIGLNPIHSEEGMFILAAIIDVSERRKTEAEMQRHRQELAHVSRVSIMGELSASMAHELNQPLTAILANAQAAQRFMANGKVDVNEFREILADIAYDTTRARDVIRHLRALVKKSKPDFTRVNVDATIREVIRFLHGDIVARNVRVALDLAPDLPTVHGDRTQLQQVIINLLLNAFDALNSNAVPERVVSVTAALTSPEVIRVTVSDRGVGIPADKLESIFEPFHSTKPEGMGMGLSVTRSIIDSHQGRVWAENNVEGGASFHFTLPADEGAQKQ